MLGNSRYRVAGFVQVGYEAKGLVRVCTNQCRKMAGNCLSHVFFFFVLTRSLSESDNLDSPNADNRQARVRVHRLKRQSYSRYPCEYLLST